jgi:endonuclease/exonuclease/phosphatase family metal-dependent hydrolase
MAFTILTWNLQGSQGVDVAAVAGAVRELTRDRDPDVVALQEVQWHQARALGTVLGMHHRWVFKHWPVRTWPEGLAVLSRERLVATRRVPLQGAPFWSWRRRVALLALVAGPDGQVGVADVHFSPHDAPALRRGEAARLVVSLERFGTST